MAFPCCLIRATVGPKLSEPKQLAQGTEPVANDVASFPCLCAWRRCLPAVEPHSHAVLAGDQPKAVVLDFIPPQRPRRWTLAFVGRHGAINPAGRGCCIVSITKGYGSVSQSFFDCFPREPSMISNPPNVGVRQASGGVS
jgi:hypothetical protein